jgi:2-polyprenyl-3-methyl-5-hydroxy-6-metoxy-1,4-benzoquinol methylase
VSNQSEISILESHYPVAQLLGFWEQSQLSSWNKQQKILPCPVCRSASNKKIAEWKVDNFFYALFDDDEKRLENIYLTDIVPNVSISSLQAYRRTVDQALSGKLSVSFLQCEDCEAAYQNYPHTEESVSAYYRKYYRIPYEELNQETAHLIMGRTDTRWIGQQRSLVNYFWQVIKDNNPHSVLDIGCAEGHSCKLLEEKGLVSYGIEPSEQMVRFAKEKLGLSNVIAASYCEESYQPKQFDAILSHHVIEHVFDFKKFLRAVRFHLRDGGKFLLQTPCIETFQNKSKLDLVLFGGHLQVFSEKALLLLLHEAGFREEEVLLAPLDLNELPNEKRGEEGTAVWGDDPGGISICAVSIYP